MARMRRGLVHALAWSLATGAAVTLSWWGVHTVLAGSVYDRPSALPLAAVTDDDPAAAPSAPPRSPVRPDPGSPAPSAFPSASPARPSGRPPSPAPADPDGSPSAHRPSPGPSEPNPPDSSGSSAGTVRSHVVDGGRVAFDLGETSAELVSATPASGWRMQVWKQDTWIRVTFTRDGREVSVFCVWHDGPPRVEVDERDA
ncbi:MULTISPECIES: hypothetical protein [Streptomyces]|uniref:Secreted protein n=2 Tax=Streptomyces TaxID=1883 RepID=A0A100Y2A2_9ACTN|nr:MULTISPECIES: hypothetical protein [Streptomyces]KUH36371.1 hypothetical protein ATE80_23890 [Streptomyces kanasensis]UUS31223.1 hypothetical protein NRO40_10485 [Streptomyces changanensis]